MRILTGNGRHEKQRGQQLRPHQPISNAEMMHEDSTLKETSVLPADSRENQGVLGTLIGALREARHFPFHSIKVLIHFPIVS